MRNIYLTFLVIFFGLLLNCNNTKLKENDLHRVIGETKIEEIFSLVKPINKPVEPTYKTLYNGFSILINSNSSNQELIFIKGKLVVNKVLKFYYETPEIVFHVYKSNLDNIVIIIEGRDYYGSNLGIYYIENKSNQIIEIDNTLTYNQDDPEAKGFKLPKAEVIKNGEKLRCTIYLGNKILYNKNYDVSTIEANKKNAISNIDKYINDSKYFIKTFDINNDGINDKIISSKPYEGDDLFVFFGDKNSNYKLMLKTFNFSQDGGNQISDIKKTNIGFEIITKFPDRGDSKCNYYIINNNQSFILKKIKNEYYSWQNKYTKVCIQNFNLDMTISKDSLFNIIGSTKEECLKQFDSN